MRARVIAAVTMELRGSNFNAVHFRDIALEIIALGWSCTLPIRGLGMMLIIIRLSSSAEQQRHIHIKARVE